MSPPAGALRDPAPGPSGARAGEQVLEGATDGRHLRRQRNRQAVVDALLSLYRDGHLRPSSAEIAERAGLSPRSLFRYFDDVEDLCRAAIGRQEQLAAPLLVVAAEPDEPLEVRIDALVAQRLRLYEAIGPAAAVARLEAPFQPLLAEELHRTRTHHRAQLQELFAPELEALGSQRGPRALAALDVVCSFEAFVLLRHEQGLPTSAVAGTWGHAFRELLRRPGPR